MSVSMLMLEEILVRLGVESISTIVKYDDERALDGGEPWTVVLSGAGIRELIRAESVTLTDCLDQALLRLLSDGADRERLRTEIEALRER